MEPQGGDQLGRTELPIGALTTGGGVFRAPLVRVLRWWLGRRIRAGLDGVFVSGRPHLDSALEQGPVVVACTHQSWWDGLVAAWLTQSWQVHPMLLMRADNLERWPFFEAFGAVGIAGGRGIRRCLARLQRPGDLLWTFPQGEYRDPAARPLGLQRGTVWIARRAGAVILPVALGYRFGQQPRVQAVVSIGAAIPTDSTDDSAGDAVLLEQLEVALIDELERIGSVSVSTASLVEAGFVPVEGSTAVPAAPRPDLASRLLGWIWRWS